MTGVTSSVETAAFLVAASATIRSAVSDAGVVLSIDGMRATVAEFAPFQLDNCAQAIVERDLPYGPHDRHRLDWFSPAAGAISDVVVLFVHGGGFVGGDRSEPDSPLHDNVGYWAAANGFHAVIMSYRLAPKHRWPAAAEDVSAAIAVILERIANLQGGPKRLFIMGHSAGAVHAAAGVLMNLAPGVAGAILISGFYDNTIGKPNSNYFGDDPALYSEQSTLSGLATSRLPLFLIVAEYDPSLMYLNAAKLMLQSAESRSPLPRFLMLDGNNHFSPILLLNSSVDILGPRLIEFFSAL